MSSAALARKEQWLLLAIGLHQTLRKNSRRPCCFIVITIRSRCHTLPVSNRTELHFRIKHCASLSAGLAKGAVMAYSIAPYALLLCIGLFGVCFFIIYMRRPTASLKSESLQ